MSFLLLISKPGRAQLNNADSSLFNSIFTSSLYIQYWNFPYLWYVDDSISSKQDLLNRFNTGFPFVPADLNPSTYANIVHAPISYVTDVNASFNQLPWIYNQTDPLVMLPFSLNGKTDTAYSALTPGIQNGDCSTAFLLIHGNGTNTTTLMLQGSGYGAVYCNVKNTCQQYGDVYSYSKPNEDWRAIYWNRKKLNDYVYNYCEAIGHNYGTNYLIETIALVKSLKKKYSRVIVIGLSEGGYTTLLNLLNTEPDGAVVSGGYSINFDTYTPSQFTLSNRFGNAPQYYTRDTVKSIIGKLQTNTLFTYGENDAVELMDPEHDFHYTQNFLNNPAKCSFFYNFNTHTFPPCNTLDTFIQRIIGKPKAFIYPLDTVCTSDSLQMKIKFCGIAPFQCQLFKNDVWQTNLTSNTDSLMITVFSEGNYQVKNIVDATNHPCINSESYTYVKDAPIGFTILSKQFDCDSNHTEISLQFNGTSPWLLSKTINGLPDDDTLISATVTQPYPNMSLTYVQLSDSNHCTLSLNQSLTIADSLIDFDMSLPTYDCDSNKTVISIALEGRRPWLMNFKKNGVIDSILIDTNATKLYFDNGLYELISLRDSNNCSIPINMLYTFDYDTLSVATTTPLYDCDSAKTKIQFSFTGNPPYDIHYTQNGNPLTLHTADGVDTFYFDDGVYDFLDVSDVTGCTKAINQSLTFNTEAINYTQSVPVYNCDSNKTLIHFDLQGNAPWTIQYTQNGNAQQVSTMNNSQDLLLENGIYYFVQLNDATCTKNINQIYTFNFDTLAVQVGLPAYHCDSAKTQIIFTLQGNPPYDIHYTWNGNPQTLHTAEAVDTFYFDDGVYNFLDVSDITGCTKTINQSLTFNTEALDYTQSVPVYNCDSNKTLVHFDLQGNAPWTIQYTQNGIAQQLSTMNNSQDLLLENGIYYFVQINDVTCTKNINQAWVFNYDTLAVQVLGPSYSCDSGKMWIQFDLQGNPPFVLHYLQNGLLQTLNTPDYSNLLFLPNGQYDFLDVSDATGCTQMINQSYNLYGNPISYQMSAPIYICDSNKALIHFDLQGNAPWTVIYTKDGNAQQVTTYYNSLDFLVGNGLYQFVQINDASCFKNINQSLLIDYDSLEVVIDPPIFNCDSNKMKLQILLQGNPPFEIHYSQNGSPVTYTTASLMNTFYLDNGVYSFNDVTDVTGCLKNINQNYTFNTNAIGYTLTPPQYICDSNKTLLHFDLQGNAPWIISYTKDATPLQILSFDDSVDLYVDNGLYQFIQVNDAACASSINQSFSFQYDSIGIQISPATYQCDSNKTKLAFTFNGNPPFTLQYTENGLPQQFTSNNYSNALFLANGTYVFQTLIDGTGCTKTINQSFTFSYQPIDVVLATPQYDCDSNKTKLTVNTQGNSPWSIQYLFNGLPQQFTIANPTTDLFLANGNYQFMQISDATCSQAMIQGYSFNYDSIGVQLSNPVYDCDSNKSSIQFSLQGNPPFTIHYTQNGNALQLVSNNANLQAYFANGTYQFADVTDATGCVQSINQTFVFLFDTLDFFISTPDYNCDSNKTHLTIDLQGNPPFVLSWLYNGNPQSMITNNFTTDLYLTNGNYQFTQVSDLTNCTKNINQSYLFNYEPVAASVSQEYYHCDSNKFRVDLSLQGNAPWTVYYNNGVTFQTAISGSPALSLYLPNGNWTLEKAVDATGCEAMLNANYNLNFVPLNVSALPAVYDCDSNKSRVDFTLGGNAPWTIHFTNQLNNIEDSVTTYDPNYTLYLNNGLYLIGEISDSTNCQTNVMQTVNNFYAPLSFQHNPDVYNCDSTKMRIDYSFTGDAPFTLSYKNNITGIISQHTTLQPHLVFYLGDGDYTVLSVQDLKCTRNIDDTLHIHYPKLISSMQPAAISCDSNKLFVRFKTPQGNLPFTYYYFFNNNYTSFTTYDTAYTFYLNNGQYFFDKVIDSMGCSIDYQQALTANYNRFQYHGFSSKYNCVSDSTALWFDIVPFMKTEIRYTLNGGQINTFTVYPNINPQFMIGNGSYHIIDIIDSMGCSQVINDSFVVSEEPVAAQYDVVMNCPTHNYTYQFQLQGKSPWTLHYNFHNLPLSKVFTDSNALWNVEFGNYYIQSIIDANGCVYTVQKHDTLKPFLNDYPTLYYRNFTLHTIHTPYRYFWYKNDQLIDSLSVGEIPSHGNGVYKVLIIDSLGCQYWSNELTLDYPANINVFPNPSHHMANIVVNEPFGDYWQYQLFDMSGKLLAEKTLDIPSAQLDLSSLEGGVYTLVVRYENQNSNQKNVIRLIKE